MYLTAYEPAGSELGVNCPVAELKPNVGGVTLKDPPGVKKPVVFGD